MLDDPLASFGFEFRSRRRTWGSNSDVVYRREWMQLTLELDYRDHFVGISVAPRDRPRGEYLSFIVRRSAKTYPGPRKHRRVRYPETECVEGLVRYLYDELPPSLSSPPSSPRARKH